MPRNFIINNKNIDIHYKANNIATYEVISHEQEIDLAAKDKFVLLENKNDESPEFTKQGIIENITNPVLVPLTRDIIEKNKQLALNNKPPLPREYLRTVKIKIDQTLTGNNLFEDYIYSLLVIHNYADPLIHVKQKSKLITPFDFETITQGKIYVSRTAFGKLVNALPIDNKFEFTLYAMKEFKTTTFRKIDYLSLLAFLINYIEVHILSVGNLLLETNTIIENDLVSSGMPIDEIGFIDEETGQSNLINEQAKRFKKLFDLEKQIAFFAKIKDNATQNKDIEKEFEKTFHNRPWPLNLN